MCDVDMVVIVGVRGIVGGGDGVVAAVVVAGAGRCHCCCRSC